jgi:WD40 repeat protein
MMPGNDRRAAGLLIAALGVAGVIGCRKDPPSDHAPLPAPSAVTVATASASVTTPPLPPPAPDCPGRRWLTSFDFAPDGKRLVTSCDSDDCDGEVADTAIEVWDLAAGRVARTLEAPSGAIQASWAGDGLVVAQSRAGTGVKDITLWETRGFTLVHAEPHYCAYPAFDHASRRMLITGCDGAMQIFDVKSHRRILRPGPEAHVGGDFSVEGWFSHDGRRVYVQDESAGLQALNPATLRRTATLANTGTETRVGDAPTAHAAWDAETDRFALLDASGAVRLVAGDLSVTSTLTPAPPSAPAQRITWLDARSLALDSEDGTISILDVASRSVRITLPPAPPAATKCGASLTMSPKHTWIAFRRTDCAVELLDAALKKQWSIPARTLSDPAAAYSPTLAFSPDDSHLAALFDERALVIYDAASGAEKTSLKLPSGLAQASKSGGTSRPIAPAWSPDGRFAAVAQGEVFLVRPDGAFVVLSAFDEAGKRVVVASSRTGFDGPAALESCAFQASGAPRAPRRAEPGLLASFFAAPTPHD